SHRIAFRNPYPSECFHRVFFLVQVGRVAIDRRLILSKDYVSGKLLVSLIPFETELVGVLELDILLAIGGDRRHAQDGQYPDSTPKGGERYMVGRLHHCASYTVRCEYRNGRKFWAAHICILVHLAMLERFLNHIRQNQLFEKEHRILLAVSGGLDSTVMAYLFHQAGFTAGLAHCNFSLRGESSDGDESFVQGLAN